MQNFLTQLTALLSKDERLVGDGKLLKNKIAELALKLDAQLIELLLSEQAIHDMFFVQAGKVTLFDQDKFLKFVSSKQFLPDSYTAFRNKIGLTVNNDYLTENKSVVLSWPYKDTVLEGGQTKADAKRDEIFWNQILAPDQISRLFEPKVISNARRLPHKDKKKFSGFRVDERGFIQDNLLIKGNNLLALHSLRKRFAGQIKLVYMDPPYNTGGSDDIFTYNNNFKHSTWLTFVKNRLEIARELMREDGFIAITIDHVELFYLGALADEIFGAENRVGLVTILINPKGRQHEKFFSASTEYMLVYAKDSDKAEFNKVTLDNEIAKTFDQEDDEGKFRWQSFARIRTSTSREAKPAFYYPIYVSPDLSDLAIEPIEGYTPVYPVSNEKDYTWKTKSDTFVERLAKNQYRAHQVDGRVEIQHKYREQQVLKNLWTDKKYFPEFQGTNLLKKIVGEGKFSYPKSLYAVMDTIKLMSSGDDIVLDFFAGSGTTGHAVINLNREDGGRRQFILVEQLEEHISVCRNRLLSVIGDGAETFVELELAKLNQQVLEDIQKAPTKEQLLNILAKLNRVQLAYQVDNKSIDSHKDKFEQLPLETQKQFLLECVDQNHLYVNYSDMNDEEYQVSDHDKKISKEFYSG